MARSLPREQRPPESSGPSNAFYASRKLFYAPSPALCGERVGVRGSHLFGSNASEGRTRNLYTMAEVRACGPTPVDRPSKWLPLTLTLSPLRGRTQWGEGQTSGHGLRAAACLREFNVPAAARV